MQPNQHHRLCKHFGLHLLLYPHRTCSDANQSGQAPEIARGSLTLETASPDRFHLTDAEDGSSVYSFAAEDRVWYIGEGPDDSPEPENDHEIEALF